MTGDESIIKKEFDEQIKRIESQFYSHVGIGRMYNSLIKDAEMKLKKMKDDPGLFK